MVISPFSLTKAGANLGETLSKGLFVEFKL
jgi:hypothetical protein